MNSLFLEPYDKADGKYIVFLKLVKKNEKQAEQVIEDVLEILRKYKVKKIEEVPDEARIEIQAINDRYENVYSIEYCVSPMEIY